MVNDCDARASLPHDVAPGGSVEVYLRLTVPSEPDDYTLELDLVQEGVAWFRQQGRPALALPFLAEGERVPRRVRVPGRERPAPAGLKERHPRIHRLLQASGLLALRSALAPAWWRARQAVRWHLNARVQYLAEWLRQAADPPMDMQGIPRLEVLDLIALAGARPLDVENAELAHAGWQAYRYWVTRD